MPRFNPSKWKPVDDSSLGFRTVDPRCVVLKLSINELNRPGCPCGCGEFPLGGRATFKMGHDARLRGILIRAHLMSTRVLYIVNGAPDPKGPRDAIWVAEQYGWAPDLEAAALRREGANRQLLRHAMNTERTIKVGRWEYTGQVAAVFPTAREDLYLIKYVDRAGQMREIRVPASEAPLAS